MATDSLWLFPASARQYFTPPPWFLSRLQTLLISFRLQESKIGVVSSTAAATLRQLVMFIFENVDEEDRRAEEASKDSSLRGEAQPWTPTLFFCHCHALVSSNCYI